MTSKPRRIIRLREVLHRVGDSKPTLYRKIKAGRVPAPIKLNPPDGHAVGWDEAAVDRYVDQLLGTTDDA